MDYKKIQTFTSILLRDVYVFKQHVMGRVIDACVWAGVSLYVAQYILPLFGMDQKFASFLLLGNIVVWGMFEIGTNMSIVLGDLQGVNSLSYYVSLPLPSSWIFIRMGLMDAYRSIIPTLPLLPLGKLILGDHIDLSAIHYPKLLLTWLMSHMLFAFFGLYLSSLTNHFDYITTIRQRIIFPLWFLGCYQFTWYMLHHVSPTIAYVNLLNPVVYAMEAMRGCTHTDIALLPYWLCLVMIIVQTILFAYLGIKQFKKRIDCL